MLSAEIKVNSLYIGGLYIVRTDMMHEESHMYNVEYNVPMKDKIVFQVFHCRKDGAEVLVKKCMDEVVRKMKRLKKGS